MIVHVVNEFSREVRPGSRGDYMKLVILEMYGAASIGCWSKIFPVPNDMLMQRSD